MPHKYSKYFTKALSDSIDSGSVSVADLVEKTGLSRQAIYDYRKGHVPSLESAALIADALGKSLAEMIGEPSSHPIDECYRRVGEALHLKKTLDTKKS